jgi:hypothetical protein
MSKRNRESGKLAAIAFKNSATVGMPTVAIFTSSAETRAAHECLDKLPQTVNLATWVWAL